MAEKDEVGRDEKAAVAYDDFGAARIKHLEMIQAVITRLAKSSFLIKGWALTSFGVFMGLSIQTGNAPLAAISMVLTLAFWGLDTWFLRSERLFRALFNRIRIGDQTYPPFYMSATSPGFAGVARREDKEWRRVFLRSTLSVFYGSIAAATFLVALGVLFGGFMPQPSLTPSPSVLSSTPEPGAFHSAPSVSPARESPLPGKGSPPTSPLATASQGS